VGKGKVMIALSGGVDSSVTASLLLEEGYQCQGVYMITCDEGASKHPNVQTVADEFGIELFVVDMRDEFENVLNYFGNEYTRGRTPNPCVFCNRNIKFGKLWDFAKSKGVDFFATGHYAKVLRWQNTATLYAGDDTAKEQSYALAMIQRDVFDRLLLPLGSRTKTQTKKLAAMLKLGLEDKAESQEICFIPDDDYIAVLEKRWPQLVRKGNIIDSSGNILGQHDGIHRFTIGQRRGLKVAMGVPYYVVKLDAQSNTVTLGPKPEVMSTRLWATNTNWLIDKPQQSFRAKIKIRYNSPGVWGTVIPGDDGFEVIFEDAVSAVTPGQLAVAYIDDDKGSKVVCGGWIDQAQNTEI